MLSKYGKEVVKETTPNSLSRELYLCSLEMGGLDEDHAYLIGMQ